MPRKAQHKYNPFTLISAEVAKERLTEFVFRSSCCAELLSFIENLSWNSSDESLFYLFMFIYL